jgi:hypothetical protein
MQCVEKIQSCSKKPFNAYLPDELKIESQPDFEERRQAWGKAVELYASLKPKEFYANLKPPGHEQSATSVVQEAMPQRPTSQNSGGNAVAISISS